MAPFFMTNPQDVSSPALSSAISIPFKLVTLTLIIFEKSTGKWNGILKTEKEYLQPPYAMLSLDQFMYTSFNLATTIS